MGEAFQLKVCWNMYVLVYLFRMLFCVYEMDKSILFKNILARPRTPFNIPGYVYFHYTILFPCKISEILLINKYNFAIVMPFLIQLSYLHFLFSLYYIICIVYKYTLCTFYGSISILDDLGQSIQSKPASDSLQ